MVVATAQRAFTRADIAQWVNSLVEQGQTEQEAETVVFDEILRDGMAEELMRVLGPTSTVGAIRRQVAYDNRPARLVDRHNPRPNVKSSLAAMPVLVRVAGAPPAVPQTFGAPRIDLAALAKDTSLLSGKYQVNGEWIPLAMMTKAHCRVLADQYAREARTKTTYAVWFRRLTDSLKDEYEMIGQKWDEPRLMTLFAASDPKI